MNIEENKINKRNYPRDGILANTLWIGNGSRKMGVMMLSKFLINMEI